MGEEREMHVSRVTRVRGLPTLPGMADVAEIPKVLIHDQLKVSKEECGNSYEWLVAVAALGCPTDRSLRGVYLTAAVGTGQPACSKPTR